MNNSAAIPASVTRFVRDHVWSLDQLELLLLLQQSDKWWDAASVARELGMDTASARRMLERFASQNLLAIAVTGDVRYRFQPGEARLREAADAFLDCYRTNRLAVLRLVTGQVTQPISDFAEAFRIRHDDDS
jgi:DNA-binding IclR family transcriptional regulator